MRCRYCFYTQKQALFGPGSQCRMADEVLKAYVRTYMETQPAPEVNFAWQGGEPTLMGLDFFRRAVELQERYAGGKHITNSVQTNGILLDDDWCEFLASEDFLAGLSIDGPADIQNIYRVDCGGRPTFDRVRAAMQRLQRWNVRYNTLSCVTAESAGFPVRIYDFLKNSGTQFMQFIPVVERAPDERSRQLGLKLAEPRPGRKDESKDVMPWSVEPEQYGDFLISIFDRWVKADVGRVFVQIFDVSLAAWAGQEPPLCNFSRTCGDEMVIEHNGDLYSCDHFVYPHHRLGNILTESVEKMLDHPSVRNLGRFKWDGLPQQCRRCDVLFVCHGGCPKNRFVTAADGGVGLNYLCEGYRKFFRHVDPYMKKMANLLRQGRAPAEIMYEQRASTSSRGRVIRPAFRGMGRNDPCPCGSGKQYKHCCGRKT